MIQKYRSSHNPDDDPRDCVYCRARYVIKRKDGEPYKADPVTGEPHTCPNDPATQRRRGTMDALIRNADRGTK